MQGSCRRTLGDQGSNSARIAAEIRRKGLASTQRKPVAVSGTAHGAKGSCGLVSEITPIMKEKIQAETVSETLHCNVRPPFPTYWDRMASQKPSPGVLTLWTSRVASCKRFIFPRFAFASHVNSGTLFTVVRQGCRWPQQRFSRGDKSGVQPSGLACPWSSRHDIETCAPR